LGGSVSERCDKYYLRNAILALVETPGATVLGIPRLFTDEHYRSKIVSRVTDPTVRAFWTKEYDGATKAYRTEAAGPVLNKMGQFLTSSIVRNIVSQPRSTINPRKVMDEGKILVVNLSKGKIGEDNAAIIGAMMTNRFQLAALDRADLPERERRDFWLYVDEFQSFATDAFATILSEARKYRLGLVCANQFFSNFKLAIYLSILGRHRAGCSIPSLSETAARSADSTPARPCCLPSGSPVKSRETKFSGGTTGSAAASL
jgi:hypothetical protein